MEALNGWAKRYAEMLEEGDPTTFARMKADGTLYPTARQKGEDAEYQASALRSTLRRQNPPPKGALERLQYHTVQESQIREIVLNDLYQPPPDEEDAEDE